MTTQQYENTTRKQSKFLFSQKSFLVVAEASCELAVVK